jgi:hypothetical protein
MNENPLHGVDITFGKQQQHYSLGRYTASEVTTDVFYIVLFGLLANLTVIAACLTTMSLVRKRVPVDEEKTINSAEAEEDRPMDLEAVSAPHIIPHPQQQQPVPTSAYRLLASCPPPRLPKQPRQHMMPDSIPEVHAACRDVDMQMMLLSSANVKQFFSNKHVSSVAPIGRTYDHGSNISSSSSVEVAGICWNLN